MRSILSAATRYVPVRRPPLQRQRHKMSQPPRTFALNSNLSVAPIVFQSQPITNSNDHTAATHIAVTRTDAKSLRHMIYECPANVWVSRLNFTAHLKRINIPAVLHGALHRLMAVPPEKRVGCVDLADINLLFESHLSLLTAAAPKNRERQALDALRRALNASGLKPTVCGFMISAADEFLDLNKCCEACDAVVPFEPLRHSNISFITAIVLDEAPAQCACCVDLWVASDLGAKALKTKQPKARRSSGDPSDRKPTRAVTSNPERNLFVKAYAADVPFQQKTARSKRQPSRQFTAT